MRKPSKEGEIDDRNRFRYGLLAALAFRGFLVVCISTILVQPVSALTWVSANGCWTATNGDQNLVMWNATGSNTWTVPAGVSSVWYLVVAGGGGGGGMGGGGGGGGVLNGTLTTGLSGSLPVTVGAGGAGGTTAQATNGSAAVFASITATGGGGGGTSGTTAAVANGASGGSGGGGAGSSSVVGTGGTGTVNQGNAGGAGAYKSSGTPKGNMGGGGGGASGIGVAATTTVAGNGGAGTASSITSVPVTYGGGGGGGANTGTASSGGAGGGGAGSVTGAGTAGTVNTGGGGGGSFSTATSGGTGGSGIVIISYIIDPPTFVSAETNTAGTVISITFNKTMSATYVGTPSEYTVMVGGVADTVTGVVRNETATTNINLTLTTAVTYGQSVTVAYTGSDVKSADGGKLNTFTAQTVTNNVPAGSLPTFVSAATNTAGTAVIITFSKTMSATYVGTPPEYTVMVGGVADTVTGVVRNETTTTNINLTLTTAAAYGQSVTVAYTGSDVQSEDSGILATFTAQTVTNNVPAGSPPTFVSAATNTAGTSVIITFSKTMSATYVGTPSEYTVMVGGVADTVTVVARDPITTPNIDLTLTTAATHGQSVTVAYTGSDVKSEDGGVLATFTAQTVTNMVSALTWVSANGCWTATNGERNFVMWNATGSNTWTVPAGVSGVWYLIVAGGGGGGGMGGGGGGGGVLNGTLTSGLSGSLPVTVGAGGAGGTTAQATNGTNSVFASITATGGGGGGTSGTTAAVANGASGGSGGGGAGSSSVVGTGGTGTVNQGNAGGAGAYKSSGTPKGNMGGGGGGASGIGIAATISAAGNGGAGTAYSITSAPVVYGGGGGGGANTGSAGSGGTGGGGAGSVTGAGTAGTANTGGGGGGSFSTATSGGTGGSGIVIISYITPPTFVSAATNTAGMVISVTFNKTMANPAGKQDQFTYSINGGTAQTFSAAALNINPYIIDLTTSGTIPYGKTITLNYTAGTVTSQDGGVLVTFSNKAVTNNVVTSVAITLNQSSIYLPLNPGSSATNQSLGITVSANVPFTVSVADNTGRGSYLGYLGNYTGSAYAAAGPRLGSPLGLAGTTSGTTTAQTITPPITTSKTLYTGSAGVTNQILAPNTCSQPVAYTDIVLPSGSTYRIELLFTIGTS